MRPEPAGILETFPFSCRAPRLAGESSNDPIHSASKRFAIEGSGIRPNRRRLQEARFNMVDQERGSLKLSFHVKDWASIWIRESEAEIESAAA